MVDPFLISRMNIAEVCSLHIFINVDFTDLAQTPTLTLVIPLLGAVPSPTKPFWPLHASGSLYDSLLFSFGFCFPFCYMLANSQHGFRSISLSTPRFNLIWSTVAAVKSVAFGSNMPRSEISFGTCIITPCHSSPGPLFLWSDASYFTDRQRGVYLGDVLSWASISGVAIFFVSELSPIYLRILQNMKYWEK